MDRNKIKYPITVVFTVWLMLFSSCSPTEELTFPKPRKQDYYLTKYSFLRNGESSVETLDAKEQTRLLGFFQKMLEGYYTKKVNELQKQFSTGGFLFPISLKDISMVSKDLFVAHPIAQQQIMDDFTRNLEKITELGDFELKKRRALPGKAGWIGYQNGNVTNTTMADEKGLVWHLSIGNSLVGLTLLDQIVNMHLGDGVLKDEELRRQNNNQILVAKHNYTELEHHWDMAYELVRSKYIRNILEADFFSFPFLSGANKRVNSAFIAGREAITRCDYPKAEFQAGIIYRELSRAMAAQVIYLLKTAQPDVEENVTNAFQLLSEAHGYMYGLIASRRSDGSRYMNRDTALELLTDFTNGKNGFWDTDHLKSNAAHKGSMANLSQRLIELFELWEEPDLEI